MKSALFVLFVTLASFGISQTKIAIIGGGMAGISSAYYIHQFDPSAEITIFEKEAQVGGNAQSITVKNKAGENVVLDIGPQYFTKGPWNEYLEFLYETLGEENIKSELVDASLLIQRKNTQNPLLVSPAGGKLRGEKLSNLLKFRKFDMAAFRVYQHPEKWRGKTVADWLPTVKLDEEYKTTKVLPFLAASLGTTVAEIKTCSIVELVKLFAFRKPKLKTEFSIMKEGMGGLIIRVGKELEKQGVNIKTSTPVYEIGKSQNGYHITYGKGESIQADPEEYDFVVLAVHADVAAMILRNEISTIETANLLKEFKYFQANIVVHSDTNYINSSLPTFLNIFTNEQNEVGFSTMNLSVISPRLDGIYKSWVSEDDKEEKKKMKANGTFLEETTFWHQLITPQFVSNLEKLNEQMKAFNNLVIIGGWSEGLETQNSAVQSAQRSLEKYKTFKK